MKKIISASIVPVLSLLIILNMPCSSDPKDATGRTRASNAAVLKQLDFSDKQDIEDCSRGLITQGTGTLIKDAKGRTVWDLDQYSFLEGDAAAPDTVNPSLWRLAKLNMIHGLFKVTDHVYQVRGYDLSNISFIEGKTGYIVVDPLVCNETAKEALDLMHKYVGKKPVVAVIYTHSHVDHWAGVKGVVSEDDVRSGKVKIIASQGFLEEAVSENVTAGNAMSRRAMYMYGNLLPKGVKGQVDAGLGKTVSSGTVTIIEPTDIITKTGQKMNVDGVDIVFQYTPNTEAPTEMNFYFPQYKALCMAENCTHTLHNLYTLRGTKVRDAKAWAAFLNEAIELFGDKAEVMFASHHWPRWGSGRIVGMMEKQRDAYRFIHDQTLRLANEGLNMTEIAEKLELPAPLAKEWYNRGYYGSVNHDVKAVFQRYLGWFDGNPANLHPLTPVEAGKKYVEFMGGSASVIGKARKAYEKGDYRWVAQVLNHVVFAEPGNRAARELEADALEQLGYQAESGPWRNFYLTGALELRKGVIKPPLAATPPDVIKALTLDMLFDYMAIRLNGSKAAGKTIKINWDFTDTGEKYLLSLKDSVLNNFPNRQADDADATLTLKRSTLNEILTGASGFVLKIAAGEIRIKGNILKLHQLMGMMDDFKPTFKIMDR